MNKTYQSLATIREDLKVLRLKKEISFELLKGNKDSFEEATKPLSLVNKLLNPFKKVLISYLLKKIF